MSGQPKKVILETNMCLSVDDVGALAMLHAFQNRGEAEILAVCLNEVHESGVAAIDAINTWYGRGDIPVGVYKGPFPDPDTSAFLEDLTQFPHDIDDRSALSAAEVYQDILAKQPDNSVTIISVGFMNNLGELLRKDPGLVAKKVTELVIMGAHNGDDHNLGFHNTVSAARHVLEHWPSPLVFHHLGGDIMTGLGLEETPAENPVREAYYKYFGSRFRNQPSWDQITVLYGVRGASGYFSKNSTGTGSIPSGFTWELKARNDSFLEPLLPADAYAKIIEELMLEAPVKKIIFETDMCLDVDDVGALAMLHALADRREVEILAVCFNEVHKSGIAAIDAINTWYGRGDIPIGIYRGALDSPDDSRYLDEVARFPHDLSNETAPSALDVYLQVLREQSDKSVTIISVGFLNNLHDLLKADRDLITDKVGELVVMAGHINDGFNMVRHNLVDQSEYVLRHWPTPLAISHHGHATITGAKLCDAPAENPVREAYYRWGQEEYTGRCSWDQVAVLYGVRGVSTYFDEVTTGIGRLRNEFEWEMKPGFRSHLNARLPNEAYVDIIEPLMIKSPK